MDFEELGKIPMVERIPWVGLYCPVPIVGFLSFPEPRGRAEGLERAEPWELWGSLTLEALQGDNAVTGDEPAGTADTAFPFKCKHCFMVQESISHRPAQTV